MYGIPGYVENKKDLSDSIVYRKDLCKVIFFGIGAIVMMLSVLEGTMVLF